MEKSRKIKFMDSLKKNKREKTEVSFKNYLCFSILFCQMN